MFHLGHIYVHVGFEPGWPGGWVGVQFFCAPSQTFFCPLPDVAFLKTAGQAVPEHLDELEVKRNADATERPAWDRYTMLGRIYFGLQSFWGAFLGLLGFFGELSWVFWGSLGGILESLLMSVPIRDVFRKKRD